MHRPNRKYQRLFKVFNPKIWNLTGSSIIIPNIEDIKELFVNPDTATNSQQNVLSMSCDDFLIGSNPDHALIWDKWMSYYLLSALDDGLNKLPQNLSAMEEKDFDSWLSKADFEKCNEKIKIAIPDPKTFLDDSASSHKTKTSILTLSLENNATVSGTANILKEFANTFRIPCVEKSNKVPFDETTNSFSIKHARKHYEFLRLMHEHQDVRI